jgi:hypothetical protein
MTTTISPRDILNAVAVRTTEVERLFDRETTEQERLAAAARCDRLINELNAAEAVAHMEDEARLDTMIQERDDPESADVIGEYGIFYGAVVIRRQELTRYARHFRGEDE